MCSRRALLSTCSLSCWSVVFGSRHSCLVSGPFLVSCQGSDTHGPGLVLLWEHTVLSSLGPCAPLYMYIVFVQYVVRFPRAFSLSRFVARSSFFGCVLSPILSCSVWHAACVFQWLHAFMFGMFCVNTWLMSLLNSCMFMSTFAHSW